MLAQAQSTETELMFSLSLISGLALSGVQASDDTVLLQLRSNGSSELLYGGSRKSRTTAALKETALLAHNQYRCMHGVGNLEWDDVIAAKAQELVDKGVFKHSTASSRMYVDESGSKKKVEMYKGENLWMCTKEHTDAEAIKWAVNSWYGELEFTNMGLVGADGQGEGGIVAHYTQVVWKKTTRVGCAVGKVGRDWDRGEGTFVVCQYGPGGNYDKCDESMLEGTRTKKQLVPKRVRLCRKKARKDCKGKGKDCLAEIRDKCAVKKIEFYDPEISHDPNSADYCPCCMDYYQLKSGNLDEEDETEFETLDKEELDKFEEAFDCCGGFDGHQKLGFQTPGYGSTRFFKR